MTKFSIENKICAIDYLCKQCLKSLSSDILLSLSTPYHIRRNKKNSLISDLTCLKERLVSFPTTFADQIHQLGYNISQLVLTGTIINISGDVARVQHALPRYCNHSMTIVVLFKRKLEYKNTHLSRNVRPMVFIHVLYELWKTPLYSREHVVIDQEWETKFHAINRK